MRETVRFAERHHALEYLRDVSEGATLVEAPGGILRIPGGQGWAIWLGADAFTYVTHYTAAECDCVALHAAEGEAERRHLEEQVRELSRDARELLS